MKKNVWVGFAALSLMLPACATGYSSLEKEQRSVGTTDAKAIATEENREEALRDVRNIRHEEIPLLQLDAQSVYRRMVNYFVPDEELSPVVTSRQLTAFIDFPAGGVSVSEKYGNNRAELAKLKQELSPLLQGGDSRVTSIRLTGFASPDGSTSANERLAGNRAIQFKNYLQKELKLDATLVGIDWAGEDWDGLRRLIAESGKEYKTDVLRILDNTPDPDKRRTALKALNKGQVYKEIEKAYFARLRRMQLAVECQSVATVTPAGVEQVALAYTNPGKLSLPEMLRAAALYRPGTEQYREIYEIAAYAHPSCAIAQLNAAAASLALGDKEQARYFLQQVDGDVRACNNLGVLALMDGDAEKAAAYFRQFMPQNPRLARENLQLATSSGSR